MARDYAKYKATSKNQKVVKNGWRSRLLLIILLLSIGGVSILGGYFYKNPALLSSKQNFMNWLQQIKSTLSHKTNKSALVEKSLKVEPKPETEVHFSFYTELPNAQVTLPEKDQKLDKPTSSPSPVNTESKVGGYFLQIGVFKNETAAGQMRVSLLLTGCDADVVPSKAGNETIYRIQQGPYASLSQAKVAQKKLQDKGINSLIKPVA